MQLSLQRRPDHHRQRSDAFDLAFELVAWDRRCHPGRGARHDDIAGHELDHFGKIGDDLGHIPDHLVEIAVLADLAIALERDAAFARMADLRRGPQRAAWRGGVERLADLPWAL